MVATNSQRGRGDGSGVFPAVSIASLAIQISIALLLAASSVLAVEAFEVGEANKRELPSGKEADGILGDFVIRNDLIEATISGDLPRRKANMLTHWADITPGCVYDLSLRGDGNDQLTLFAPLDQRGDVTHVQILDNGESGEASIESVISAANNNGLYKRHVYSLEDDVQGLLIDTTMRNEADSTHQVATGDQIRWLSDLRKVGYNMVGDAIDPADKTGYAFGWIGNAPTDTLELEPGDEVTLRRFLAVGTSPAEAFGLVAMRQGETGILSGVVSSLNGGPVTTARILLSSGLDTLIAYPDDTGRFEMALLPGSYDLEVTDPGRPVIHQSVQVDAGGSQSLSLEMARASSIAFDIRDEDGNTPCKVQFIGIHDTESPNLGPRTRAHGCLDQYHSESGRFSVQVPPGDYRVVVTHGIEFSHIAAEIHLRPGRTERVKGKLRRLVNTPGWVSTDFHNHSTPSGDNVTSSRDRVINLAAEHIEFAPTTEHNRLYDWQPFIDELGLSEELATIPGIELTGSGAHFNAFPYEPDPYVQDGGGPEWQVDPRINAIVLRDFQRPWNDRMPERWVHLNHPNMSLDFVDRDGDGRQDGGYKGLAFLIDGIEAWGQRILARSPWRIYERRDEERVGNYREFIWLQMLNCGHRYTLIAVSDAHSVHGNGVGGWRSYVASSTDRPAEIEWEEIVLNAKAGRVFVTNGPFLSVEAGDGTLPGGSARAQGSIPLRIRVQSTDWIDIDRVQILVNGRQRTDLNFTRESHAEWFGDGIEKFNQTIYVSLSQDSHLIVVVTGENHDLSTGYGSSWQAKMNPLAYTNPIWVDVDGGGFTPNGDNLGWDIPLTGKSVEEVRAMLEKAGLDDSGI